MIITTFIILNNIFIILHMAESRAIVIDNGSEVIRAGFSGEDAPQTIMQSVYGKPKNGS